MHTAAKFDDLVRSLYLCSAGLQEMDHFLDVAGVFYRADLLGCVSANAFDGSTRFPFFKGVSDADLQLYADYYADRNPMIAAALPLLTRGRVVQLSELFTRAELSRMEFHTDYVMRIGAVHQCGFVFRPQSDWIHTLLVCRTPASRDFTQEEKLSIQRLRKHVEASLAIESHVSDLAKAVAIHSSAIDHLSFGVIFLAADLRVLEANAQGRCLLDTGSHLQCHDGVISLGPLASRPAHAVFRKLKSGKLANGRQIQLGRDESDLPITLHVFPVGDAEELNWLSTNSARYIMFLGLHTRVNRICRRLLASEYGLTRREVEVAGRLLEGDALPDIAKQLCIGMETARSHLKSVFRKLGVNSQSQVALVVSRLNTVR